MAEALLNHMCGASFEAMSAGAEAGELNALAIKAMLEAGIDISRHRSQSVFDVYRRERPFNYVIKLCDELHGERCPLFPGVAQRIDWSFEDPAAVKGTEQEQLTAMRVVRDQIRAKIAEWCGQVCF